MAEAVEQGGGPSGVQPARAHDEVLGYLLKHAHLALQQQSDDALADLGLTSRDLGVLRVIATGEASSQQEIAAVLRIDRTSMVAFIDALESRGLVQRQQSERDRRRNVLALTPEGREVFRRAERTAAAGDDAFLQVLGERAAREFAHALRVLLDAHDRAT